MIEIFDTIVPKLQDELVYVITSGKEVNDYERIVYKYLFLSELKIPLVDDMNFELTEDSFVLYLIPDGLEFSLLRKLDDAFDKFDITFVPNSYNVIKLNFKLRD